MVKPKTVVTGACVAVLGVLTARALIDHRRPAAAPAPAQPGTGAGGFGYDVLALAVFAGIAVLIVGLYYRHRVIQLRQEHCTVGGWKRRRSWHLSEVWECPACGAICATWEGVNQHERDSVCAAYARWIAANDGYDPDRDMTITVPPWAAHQVRETAMAATVPPEHSVTTGGVDTFGDE